jgi:hypothetical protein
MEPGLPLGTRADHDVAAGRVEVDDAEVVVATGRERVEIVVAYAA